MEKTTDTYNAGKQVWERWCDDVCLWAGALMPVGVVIGNMVFEVMVALTGVVWLSRAAVVRQNPLKTFQRYPLLTPWVVWFLAVMASLVVNGPGSKGWAHDVVIIRYVIFGMALLDVGERRPMGKYLVRGFMAAVIVASVNTFAAYSIGADLLGRPLSRYTGKLGEALRISGIVSYGVPFFVTWGFLDKNLSKKAKAGILAISFLAFAQLLQTRMRTPILASLGGVLFALLFTSIRGQFSRLGWLLASLLIVGALAAFQYAGLWDPTNLFYRLYIWKVSWTVFLHHPVFGVGVSSFREAYHQVAASGAIAPILAPSGKVLVMPEQTHAHNLALMLLSSTGVVGFSCFIWLFVRFCREAFRPAAGWRLGLVGWPVSILVAGLTGENIYYSWYQAMMAFLFVLAATPYLPEAKQVESAGV